MTVIYHSYEWYIPGLLWFYTRCVFTANATMKLPQQVRFCIYTCIPRRGGITQFLRMHALVSIDIWKVYEWYMNVISLQVDSSSSAARFLACRVFQARRDVSDLERLRISSVLTTESPPTRGWGLPKFHIHVLISYTWLPLRDESQRSRIWRPASVEEHTCQCMEW